MGDVIKDVGEAAKNIYGGVYYQLAKKKKKSNMPALSKKPFDSIDEPARRYEQAALKQAEDATARTSAIGAPTLLSQIRQQALGAGPSLAEAQLKSASSRNLAQQLAMAASMRGRNPAAVQRQVLQQQGTAGRELADLTAQAKLQEASQARQQLLQQQVAADSVGSQSIDRGFSLAIAPAQSKQDYELARFNADVARDNAVRMQQQQMLSSITGAVGTVGAAYMGSDENIKKNVKSDTKSVDKFLEALSAKSYEYKNPKQPGAAEGKRFGILAQDLEKSEAGKSIVKDTPHGKMVDTTQGFGLVVAATKQLHDRLKALEAKKKG